jgi:hypothetical protein
MDGHMNLELNQALELLQADSSEGAQFFRHPGRFWSVFGALLGVILFFLWMLHTSMHMSSWAHLAGCYVIAAILSTLKHSVDIKITESEGQVHFLYRRSGVPWSALVDALLGASVVCTVLWYFLLNAFPLNHEIAMVIPFLALLINILLVPVVPLLASDFSIDVFKTSLYMVLSKDGNVIAKPTLNAHPLEMRWAQKSEDEEFLFSVAERVLALFSAAE